MAAGISHRRGVAGCIRVVGIVEHHGAAGRRGVRAVVDEAGDSARRAGLDIELAALVHGDVSVIGDDRVVVGRPNPRRVGGDDLVLQVARPRRGADGDRAGHGAVQVRVDHRGPGGVDRVADQMAILQPQVRYALRAVQVQRLALDGVADD